MDNKLEQAVKQICDECGNDRTRIMDIVIALQKSQGCVSSQAMDLIAKQVNAHRVEVEGVVSFYAFLSKDPKGKVVIRVCTDVVDRMKGVNEVGQAFQAELGIGLGETTEDGNITLEHTPCIGMCDQAPAALINDEVFTNLSEDKAKAIVQALKKDADPKKISIELGDGNNANELVKSEVKNNICKKGEIIFADNESGAGLKKALELAPADVIKEIKESKLRGRGGAGFPTGLKWDFASKAEGDQKYVLCNADEGEPGTFKDRVLLTERYDLLFEGMTITGYAIGANAGVIYLRGEYAYLRAFLENKLVERRDKNLLGKNVLGKDGFDFDIRIQMGAGAYVCGEETALISSCEGMRGDPKNRPPFPAQKGYLGCPTVVNNVETLSIVTRIMEKGAAWFTGIGTEASAGTKILSISGDCEAPGVYEFPIGIKIEDLLKEVKAENAQAVLIGGPAGQIISATEFNRYICFDDLATGGAIVIFGAQRNILEIVNEYMDFFIEENCGYCTPCRVGNVLLKQRLEKIISGKGEKADLDYLQDLGDSVILTSRCGLGQTSPNPILTTLKNFRSLYEGLIKVEKDIMEPTFDVKAALNDAETVAERQSVIY
ncbi:MAG: NADH:ubiquinone oxidoreductase [PVC group bacterium]|nr:NADH:ubiquinone oxidoreductase [PVC group bacterium]